MSNKARHQPEQCSGTNCALLVEHTVLSNISLNEYWELFDLQKFHYVLKWITYTCDILPLRIYEC